MPRGAQQLREVAFDLKRAGSPAGLRGKLRRDITAAVQPMKAEVQRNAFNIPAAGEKSTGLRVALMRATRIEISTAGRNIGVRLKVDGARMPAGQQSLPTLMEGERRWRHPVYGNRGTWVAQGSHPFVAPAIPKTLVRVSAGVDKALAETAAQLARGT